MCTDTAHTLTSRQGSDVAGAGQGFSAHTRHHLLGGVQVTDGPRVCLCVERVCRVLRMADVQSRLRACAQMPTHSDCSAPCCQ
jgi:hypothetical protein